MTTIRPFPFAYDYSQGLPLPPEADPEVLGVLAETRGRAAVDEIEGALKVLDGELQDRFRAVRSGGSVRDHLPAVLDATARHGIYSGRAAALRRLLKMKAVDVPTPSVPDLLRVLGEYPDPDVRGHVAKAAAELRTRRDEAAAELADLKAAAADAARYADAGRREPYRASRMRSLERLGRAARELLAAVKHDPQLARTPPRLDEQQADMAELVRQVRGMDGGARPQPEWPQDGLINRLSETLARRRSHESRLSALERDQAAAVAAVGHRVRSAVEAAGGRAAVVSSILAAEHLTGRFPAALAEATVRVRSLEAARSEVHGDFERLALSLGDAFNGPAADGLRAKRAAAEAAATAARAELVDRHAALAAELVDQAAAGVESARSRIEELTGLAPDAFPAGFGPAIAAARFDRAAAAELVEALQAAG